MKEIQWFVLVLHVVAGSSIINRTARVNIDDSTLEPVQLLTKATNTDIPTKEKPRIRETPRDLLQSLGYANEIETMESRHFPDNDYEETPSTDDYEASDEYSDEITTKSSPITTSLPELSTKRLTIVKKIGRPSDGTNRTKLYPVARREDRTLPQRHMPGIMEVLDAAFSCIWSGLGFECFSVKVVPMFRAMMGFPPPNPFGQQYYVLPRTSDEDSRSVDNTAEGRRRGLFGFKLVKGALLGLAVVKTLIFPILTALSVISGNAIFFSVAAVIITLAIASGHKAIDRRVFNPQQNTPYYM